METTAPATPTPEAVKADGTVERYDLMGGKCYIYKRSADSKFWQVAAFVSNRNHRGSTKLEGFSAAKQFAEEWYLELRGKHIRGELGKLAPVNAEKTFKDAAEQFLREFPVLTEGQRSLIYIASHERAFASTSSPSMATSHSPQSPRA
ncbi:hypothetical protein [Bradyrhizobium sp. SZCCHNRI1073]|uniref:hypothetical protein n=1 Tax=Bradyrhizobium sp. SZCCHNRI1073 TaxID=3057280 RepID=UPI00291698C9|nr:hypothetical protein [Bradyrhizobium sp. SZCCHNRI1073]